MTFDKAGPTHVGRVGGAAFHLQEVSKTDFSLDAFSHCIHGLHSSSTAGRTDGQTDARPYLATGRRRRGSP